MRQRTEEKRYWGVICLHCRKPFAVPFEPSRSSDPEAGAAERTLRRLFLAWCPSCHHEAPYSAGEIVPLEGSGLASRAASAGYSVLKKVAGVS